MKQTFLPEYNRIIRLNREEAKEEGYKNGKKEGYKKGKEEITIDILEKISKNPNITTEEIKKELEKGLKKHR